MKNEKKWNGIVQLTVAVIVIASVGLVSYAVVQFANITNPPTIEVPNDPIV